MLVGPDVVFSVPLEYEGPTRWALSRWNGATDWHARVGNDGIPIEFFDDGSGDCGTTYLKVDSASKDAVTAYMIRISSPMPDDCGARNVMFHTLMHEIGHVLCARGSDECHTLTGFQSATGGAPRNITDETLDVICARWGCPERKPEVGIIYPERPSGW